MKHLKKLEDEVSRWPNVSVHPHPLGGKEFLFDSAEIAHVRIVDMLFPRSVHDAILAAGLAQDHGCTPDSGWITFRVSREKQLKHAVWLMRLSYLRYALKTATN